METDQNISSIPTEIELQSITSMKKGSLGVAEFEQHVPFEVRRIFYFYDMPSKVSRGGHAHFKQRQFIICLSGHVIVKTEFSKEKKIFALDRPSKGIYLPPMTWVEICFEEANSNVLVLTCSVYDESDYIRDYDEFLNLKIKTD